MKEKFIWVIALIVLSLYLIYMAFGFVSKRNVPLDVKVAIQNTVIDLGSVSKNSEAFAIFELSNDGSNEIIINNITSDCHCTIAEWKKEPIKPYEKFFVKLTYDNYINGFFEQKAIVTFKNSEFEQLLILRGTVID